MHRYALESSILACVNTTLRNEGSLWGVKSGIKKEREIKKRAGSDGKASDQEWAALY